MIKRMQTLELESFRVFSGAQTVPLDADFVVVYGPNGAGKTSLLRAIEFAVTGEVSDLQGFSADYPRCLDHISSDSSARVSLSFRSWNDLTENRERYNNAHSRQRNPNLRAAEEHFVDRCYLSQSRLARLLELYQQNMEKGSDQPLVAFIRDLLGLEVLEHVTTGLDISKNIRGVAKRSEPLGKLLDDAEKTSASVGRCIILLEDAKARFQRELQLLVTWASSAGQDLPDMEMPAESVQAIRARVGSEEAQIEAELRRITRAADRLETVRAVQGPTTDIPSATTLANVRKSLDVLSRRAVELQMLLGPAMAQLEQQLEGWISKRDADADVAEVLRRFLELQTISSELVGGDQNEIEGNGRLAADLAKLEADRQNVALTLAETLVISRDEVASRDRFRAILAELLNHLHGEDCPVCGRDYSELNSGLLREQLGARIVRLGGDLIELEERVRARRALESELMKFDAQILELKKKVETEQQILARRSAARRAAQVVAARLQQLRPQVEELQSVTSRIQQSNLEIADAESRTSELARIEEILRAVSLEVEAEPRSEHESRADFLARLEQAISHQTIGLTERRRSLREYGTGLQRLAQVREELGRLQLELQALQAREERLLSARKRVEAQLRVARDFRRIAVELQSELLDSVFNDSVNQLWQDMFLRLVGQTEFAPRLNQLTPSRSQIRAAIQGVARNGTEFDQLAAVESAGNLNTAALSLFLVLNLIEEPRHGILVLDDPVQNMDDVRVVELTSLLRMLSRQAGRQLIIAVHERALFDYLCLELSPGSPGQSLLALELFPRDERFGTRVSSVRYQFDERTQVIGAV